MTSYRHIFLAALSLLLCSTSAVHAAKVGMVLSVSGNTEPTLEICRQFHTGATVVLGADATLTFNHYNSCEEVTVRGPGALTVRKGSYSVTDGTTSVKEFICQDTLYYEDPNMTITGIVTRDADSNDPNVALKTTSSQRPMIVTSGYDMTLNQIAKFETEDGAVAFQIPLKGTKTKWPDGQSPLIAGQHYRLTLISNGNTSQSYAQIKVISENEATLSQRFLVINFQ